MFPLRTSAWFAADTDVFATTTITGSLDVTGGIIEIGLIEQMFDD